MGKHVKMSGVDSQAAACTHTAAANQLILRPYWDKQADHVPTERKPNNNNSLEQTTNSTQGSSAGAEKPCRCTHTCTHTHTRTLMDSTIFFLKGKDTHAHIITYMYTHTHAHARTHKHDDTTCCDFANKTHTYTQSHTSKLVAARYGWWWWWQIKAHAVQTTGLARKAATADPSHSSSQTYSSSQTLTL